MRLIVPRRRVLAVLAVLAVGAPTACSSGEEDRPASAGAPSSGRDQSPVVAAPAPAPDPATTPVVTTLPAAAPVDGSGQPVPPTSPAELARRLLSVEQEARSGPGDPAVLRRLGHEHQVLQRTFARNPAWRDELVAVLPPAALARAEALAAAATSSAATVGTPRATVPAWRIRTPQDPATLRRLYAAAEAETGTPWAVLAAVNFVETRMGRIVGPSSAGAQGPMQFLPETWATYGAGGDPYDDGDAIAAAARLLADRGAPGDLPAAVRAYNPSDDYVDAVLGYAAVLGTEPWLYDVLWGWQVYVSTVDGLQWLPEGFESTAEVPLDAVALPPPVPPARGP